MEVLSAVLVGVIFGAGIFLLLCRSREETVEKY